MDTSTLPTKCVLLVIISTFVNARIILNDYTSKTNTDHHLGLDTVQATQVEDKFKWQFSNSNTQQDNELEKLIKHNWEDVLKNQESTSVDGDFGLKKSPIENDSSGLFQKNNEEDVNLSSPYILKIPVPQPYPVHIPVKEPFTVPIYKLVPKEIEKKVPIPVEKLVPIYKKKPIKVIVEKHHPYTVYKPYAVPVPVHTHILVGNKNKEEKLNHKSQTDLFLFDN